MKKWQRVSTEELFSKFGRKVECRKYILPTGEISDYFILNIKSPVCVLAITTDSQVILAKQF